MRGYLSQAKRAGLKIPSRRCSWVRIPPLAFLRRPIVLVSISFRSAPVGAHSTPFRSHHGPVPHGLRMADRRSSLRPFTPPRQLLPPVPRRPLKRTARRCVPEYTVTLSDSLTITRSGRYGRKILLIVKKFKHGLLKLQPG